MALLLYVWSASKWFPTQPPLKAQKDKIVWGITWNNRFHTRDEKDLNQYKKWQNGTHLKLLCFFCSKTAGEIKDQRNNSNIGVKSQISTQIHMLRNTFLTVDGWKQAVDDVHTTNYCNPFDIFNIQLKSKYLSVTLTQAYYHYDES
jgi:hypothetical protein